MNSFIQAYRAQVPNDPASDEDLVLDYGSKYPIDQFPQDFQADFKKLSGARAVDQSSIGQEFTGGFRRGLTGLEATGAGALALASDVFGAQGAKDFWTEIYRDKIKQASEDTPASVPTIQQAATSLPAVGQYIAGKAGELIPNVGEAVALAGAGTLAAPGPGTEAGAVGGLFARQAAKSALRRLIEKGVSSDVRKELEDYALGKLEGKALSKAAETVVTEASKYSAGLVASAGNFAAQGAGGAYGELSGREGVSDEAAIEAAAIAAAGSSVGALIPGRIIKGLFPSVSEEAAKTYVDLYAKQIPKELLTAGGGMGAMEFFNILAEKHADPKLKDSEFTKEDYSRILNAVAVGGMAGIPAAGIQAIKGVRPETAPKAPEAPAKPKMPEPGMTPKEVASVFPVELSQEELLQLKTIAEKDKAGTLSNAEKDYVQSLPGVLKARYDQIKSEVSSSKPTAVKGVLDAPSGNSKLTSNLGIAQTSLEKFDNLRDVESGSAVNHAVLALADDPQIAQSIVASIPVDVVNRFVSPKSSTQVPLNNKSVLENLLGSIPDTRISASLLSPVIDSLASARAELRVRFRLRDDEINPADIADAMDFVAALKSSGARKGTEGASTTGLISEQLMAPLARVGDRHKITEFDKQITTEQARSYENKEQEGSRIFTQLRKSPLGQPEVKVETGAAQRGGEGEERTPQPGSGSGDALAAAATDLAPDIKEALKAKGVDPDAIKSPEPVSESEVINDEKVQTEEKGNEGRVLTNVKQASAPTAFESVDDLLRFREQRRQEEVSLYKEQIGLSDDEAKRLQQLMAREASTRRFEKDIGPEKARRLERFFNESPLNQVGGPFEFWGWDKNFNPEEVAAETDINALAENVINAIGNRTHVDESPTSDRFLFGALSARKMKDLGATQEDLARALDRYTTRNSGDQESKREYFVLLSKRLGDFFESQGIDLPTASLDKSSAAAQLLSAAKPAGDLSETAWLSNVPESISALRSPRAGKEATDMFSDLGRDPKNKNRTKALGIFERADGKIVVASLYDNNGKKVFLGEKGKAFGKAIDAGLKPLGYIKTSEPQEKFYREYSPEQWADVRSGLEGKRDTAKAAIAPEPPTISKSEAKQEGVAEVRSAQTERPRGTLTAEDAGRIHDALQREFGYTVDPESVKDNLSDAILKDKSLLKRLNEVGGEDTYDLLGDILDVYEDTAREFKQSGRKTELEAFRSEVARRLEAVNEKASKAGKQAPANAPDPQQRGEHLAITDIGRDHNVSLEFQDRARLVFEAHNGRSAFEALSALLKAGLLHEDGIAADLLRHGDKGTTLMTGGDLRTDGGRPIYGKYSSDSDVVRVSETAFRDAAPIRTFLHEYAHALTVQALESGRYYAEIDPIFKRALEEAKRRADFPYALTNHGEFIAEAFSNKDFQSLLRDIPDKPGTLWGKFLGFISRLLGVKDRTALDEVLSLGHRMANERGLGNTSLGPAVRIPEWVNRLKSHTPASGGSKDMVQRFNPVTGQIETEALLQDSVEAAELNARSAFQEHLLPAPGTAVSPYVDPAIRLNREAAVNNEVKDNRDVVAQRTGIDAESFRKINGLTSTAKIGEVMAFEAHERGASSFNPNQRLAGFRNEENYGPATVRAVAQLRNEKGKVGLNLTKDSDSLPKIQAYRETLARGYDQLLDKFKDAEFMSELLKKGFRNILYQDLKKIDRVARQVGTAFKTFQEIEGKIDQPVDERTVNAFRRLYQGNALEGENLFNFLDQMANDPSLDFTRPAAQIRDYIRTAAESGPTLHRYSLLAQSTDDARALLSTVIAYGKLNQRELTLLQARRLSSAEQRVQLEQQLRDLRKETTEQILTGIKSVSKSSGLEALAKQENRKALRAITRTNRTIEQLQRRIEINKQALPVYDERLNELGKRITQTEDATFGDGMIVRVPKGTSADTGWDEFRIDLNSARGKVTTPQEIQSATEKMGVWLKLRELAALNGDSAAMGLDYQRVRRQLEEIVNNRFYDAALRNTDHRMTELVLSNNAKQIESIGTPTSSAIGVMMRKFVAGIQEMRNAADKLFGYKNPRLKQELLGIVNEGRASKDKVNQQWFTKYFLNTAFGFMEKQQPTEGRPRAEDLNLAYERLGNWLLKNESIKPLIQDRMPQLMAKIRDLIDARYESGQYWVRRNIEAGLLVEDPKLKGDLRQYFKVGLVTVPRKFSDMYFNMVHALRLSNWDADEKRSIAGARADFKKFSDLYSQNPQAAWQSIAKYFERDTVQKDFLFQLTHVPDESTIETPHLDDSGTTRAADPELVARAYDEAKGDVIQMFKILHSEYNGQNAIGDYIQDGLLGLADQFHAANAALSKVEPKTATEIQSFAGLIPNAMIDARQFAHWPSEWFDYHEFDRNDNARMAERVSGQINFGRDTRVLANLHQTLKDESDAMVAKLNDVLETAERYAPTGKGRSRRKAIDAAAEKILAADTNPMLSRYQTGKSRLEYLRQVEKRAPFIQGLLRSMSEYYNRGNDPSGSLKWGIRVAQELASLLVNQPSSAISQLATMFDIPVQWGASSTMLGRTARTIQLTAKDLAGSLAQGIGWKFLQLGEYERRFMEMNLQDPEAARRFGDIFSTLEGEENNRATKFFRVAKDVQSFPLNRLGEQAQYTPLRPLAPFFQTVISANRALTVSLWELADNYVSKGIRFLRTHPGTEKITSAELGLRGLEKDSFDRWERDVQRYGLDYTDMVNGATARAKAGDKTVLTNKELGRLYSLGLNEISLESNIATMPIQAFNNSAIRFVLPLLGWSYRRALQVAGLRLNTQEKTSLKAVSTAMLGLAATGLGGLGLSLVVDAYQEEALGKKRNIRNLRVPTTGQDWIAIQERLNRVGTFGLWGDAINGAVNVGTGQGDNRMLSVDQRAVALQAFQSIQRAISNLINEDFDPNYRDVVRPAISAIGGGGMLQYMQIANNAFDLDNAESRVIKRINAENYLRVTGRDLGMSIRTGGGGYNTPTPVTPWIARMEYAAYANDPDEFRAAYRSAIDKAKNAGKPDPADYVKKAFETRHPIRYVFAQSPSEREYQQVLANLDDRGQESVTEAVRLFNYYGASLGLAPYQGSTKKDRARSIDSAIRARERALTGFP